jgi:hypothetical protein
VLRLEQALLQPLLLHQPLLLLLLLLQHWHQPLLLRLLLDHLLLPLRQPQWLMLMPMQHRRKYLLHKSKQTWKRMVIR